MIISPSARALSCQDDYQNLKLGINDFTPTKVIPYDTTNCDKGLEKLFKLYTKGQLVVGEEDVVLEMRRVCRRVMRKARQAVIHALGGERGQGGRTVGVAGQRAVDDIVVGGRQVWHVEHIA